MVNTKVAAVVGWIGAAGNWTIPLAGMLNFSQMDPQKINYWMTTALTVYSMIFLRWSIAIIPQNWPLFACHATNIAIQATQTCRGVAHQVLMDRSPAVTAPAAPVSAK
eukprot:TRINITY_DN39234_c0_g1_i1.p2 TRINITY_DN39234_c0_g1~~TRINITY_DN39234_c0_g1_i1.p2  ORF type:complete len:108 (-),score=19.69 TRINITY_DN39234_c0_g1_i1:169-492(-)